MNDVGDRFKPTGFTRLFRAFGASLKGFTGNSEVCMRNMYQAWREYMTAQ